MDIIEEFHSFEEVILAGNPTEKGRIHVENLFPDPEGLLETATAYLHRLRSFPMEVVLARENTSTFEEYILESRPGQCRILAQDTEGIRRGIYKLGALLREFTPEALPVKREVFTPKFKVRISRYRFGSHSCPGTRYELDADSDYYPEGFLDRLASEGVNTLWFNAPKYKEFFLTKWTPDDPEQKKRYYAKLQENVDRCRRYGIKIVPYHVLPQFWSFDEKLLEEYEELAGPLYCGRKYFCIRSAGQRFLYDLFHQLFQSVRGLGGFLVIVEGEGASVCPEMLKYGPIPCQDKCKLQPHQVYARIIQAMYEGMHSADPAAELIAWFYLPYAKKAEDYVEKAMAEAPEGVIYQYNAESGAEPVQLGKVRPVWDYWQCITEPAPGFRHFAGMAARQKRRCSAKIQVGTSHEVGSIPYVPVPALTYRKYKALQSLGVTDVMQVWGTGGTPGLMNHAAGILAFTDCSKVTEEEFLRSLGTTVWGRDLAEKAAEGWKVLSDAYSSYYPYSNMIQYFGPVADGVNWPFYVYPAYKPLLPTWMKNEGKMSGDNLCECLDNHSFAEAAFLFGKLYEEWHKGCQIFREMVKGKKLTFSQEREIVRMEALEIMFGTACRIFRFYELRMMVFEKKDLSHVPEMREILYKEVENRKRMQELIALDDVLGYNPETRDYKFDIASIEKGLGTMDDALRDLERLAKGDFTIPLKFREAILDGRKIEAGHLSWSGYLQEDILHIKVDLPGTFAVRDELFIAFDNDGHHRLTHGHYDSCGRKIYPMRGTDCRIESGENGWKFELTVPVSALPGGAFEHIRFNVTRITEASETRYSWPGKKEPHIPARLNMAYYDPQDMGYLLLP